MTLDAFYAKYEAMDVEHIVTKQCSYKFKQHPDVALPIHKFSFNTTDQNGLQSYCKDCCKLAYKAKKVKAIENVASFVEQSTKGIFDKHEIHKLIAGIHVNLDAIAKLLSA